MIPYYLVNFVKDKKLLKIKIAVIVAVVLYITVSVLLSVFFWTKEGGLTPGVKIYGLSENYIADVSVNGYGDSGPVLISNGLNNTTYYTAPELDLGYITEYFDAGASGDYFAPSLVVGEGKNDDNGTVVRIYNEKQVCTVQFSAFPNSVNGGVDVAAGKTVIDGKAVTLIATAACSVYNDDARCVRVHDLNGMLYMSIIPNFYEKAPFAIATGNFVKDDDNEYLLIASSVIEDGKIEAAVYSLSDGTIKGEHTYHLGNEHDGKTVSISVRNKQDGNDSIILFAKCRDPYKNIYFNKPEEVAPEDVDTSDMYAVFEGMPSADVKKVDIVLPYGASGVYPSVNNNERYIVTSANNLFDNSMSYVYSYGLNGKEGSLLYVDYEENRFYWNAEKSVLTVEKMSGDEDSYIRYADEIVVKDTDDLSETIINADRTAEFAYWRVKLSEYGITPARSVYDILTDEYRRNPGSVVAMELFSTSDILTESFLNGQDTAVKKEFADYLTDLYGTIDDINDKFETSFEDEENIEIPLTTSESDSRFSESFINEWYRFTRYRVAKRTAALYSEAILSGLPPEILSCNADLAEQPEQTNNRYISDAYLYSLDASLGLSQKGIWYTTPLNANSVIFSAGFKNITLSSYSSETDLYEKSFYQLLYLLRNGCKYVGIKEFDKDNLVAELNALDILDLRGESRSGYANGTSGSLAVDYNGKTYNLIILGSSTNGLLKSVDRDGRRDGSVYVVPFHSKVVTEAAGMHNNPRRGNNSAKFKDVQSGSQIEVRFIASCKKNKNASVEINVYHDGILLEDAGVTYKVDSTARYYRYVFKNNLELGEIKIELKYVCEDYTDIWLRNTEAILHREDSVYPTAGDFLGKSAYGSINVDVVDRDAVYEE